MASSTTIRSFVDKEYDDDDDGTIELVLVVGITTKARIG